MPLNCAGRVFLAAHG